MLWKDEDGFLEILSQKKRYGVFLDMGLGKTALLLALIDQKIFEGAKKILIIAPKKVTLSTWQNEIRKWRNFRYLEKIVFTIEGNIDERKKILKNSGDFCVHIVSSSLVEWLAYKKERKGKRIIKIKNEATPQYDMIIVDECSQFKTPTTNRYKALKFLLKEETFLFLLSGTPFPNVLLDKKHYKNADELYYAFSLLGIYDKSWTKFKEDFCFTYPWRQYDFLMSIETYNVLNEALNNYSIRKKLELNIKRNETIIYCPADKDRFRKLKREYYIETNGLSDITADNIAIMINKSLQLANGFAYDEFKKVHRFNDYKFQALQKLLSGIKDNVAIFYSFEEDREYLLENLKGARLYDGKETEDEWNAGKIKHLILSPFSEKYGLNLQFGGHTVIWYGLVWSGEAVAQAIARFVRRGQKYDVNIFFILAEGTYDKYVYDVVVSKIATSKDFLEYEERGVKIWQDYQENVLEN